RNLRARPERRYPPAAAHWRYHGLHVRDPHRDPAHPPRARAAAAAVRLRAVLAGPEEALHPPGRGARGKGGAAPVSVVLDATHDPKLRSWVASANRPGCDFPIQNLPLAVFRRAGGGENFRCGAAIGDCVLDLGALDMLSPFDGLGADALAACAEPSLYRLMALGRDAWTALRRSAPLSFRRAGRNSGCPRGSATTPISTPPFTMPPRWAAYSGRTNRCCPTTSGCPSPTTDAPPRSGSPASR